LSFILSHRSGVSISKVSQGNRTPLLSSRCMRCLGDGIPMMAEFTRLPLRRHSVGPHTNASHWDGESHPLLVATVEISHRVSESE
jgi:hypothetical protein